MIFLRTSISLPFRYPALLNSLKGELAYLHALFSVLIGYTPLKLHIKITLAESVVELVSRFLPFRF
jgi:hypothetical protein